MPFSYTGETYTQSTLTWRTAINWNTGTLTDTQVSGSGDSAVVQLAGLFQNDDDIGYEVIGNYTLSDGAKLDIAGGNARLKTLSGDSKDWPFTTPGNYTYDSAQLEVSGGNAHLLDLRPTDATFYANYNSDIDGTWGSGVLTGTAAGGASVSGGKLDLIYNDVRYVEYAATGNADSTQTGCIRFLLTPNYAGSPAATRIFIAITDTGTSNNLIQIQQQNNGNLRFLVRDSIGNIIALQDTHWTQSVSIEYEIEFNWDLTTGANRIFIDGVQHGATETSTGTRDSAIDELIVGSNSVKSAVSDFKIDDLIIFSTVQHTSNYTPGVAIPQLQYSQDDPSIEPTSLLTFNSPLQLFLETDTSPANTGIQYQLSSDSGTTKKWWDSAAWVPITTTTTQIVPTAIATIAGTLDSGNLASIQTLDANTYDVSEWGGAPPVLRVDMDFTGIPQPPAQITVYAGYNGNLVHILNVDIYNFQTTTWDTLGQIPDNLGIITQYNFTVTGTQSDYLDTNGDVDIRLNHTSNGNTGHDLYIDYVYLLLNANPTDTWYYDNETNTVAEVQANIPTLASTGILWWKGFFHTTVNSTPSLDFIEAATTSTFSTLDNLYIDTKDTSQIAPVTIVEWEEALASTTLPANTDLRVLLSTDGRISWLGWSGSAWETEVAPTLRANATSITAFQNNFSALSIGDGTLDVRLFIYSSDNTQTPAVSNINIVSDQGLSTTGDWESAVYNSTHTNLNWGTVSFDTIVPTGASIEIKLRAANSLAELSATSYGSSLTNDEDAAVVGQYIQSKIEFVGNGLVSSSIDRLSIDFLVSSSTVISP